MTLNITICNYRGYRVFPDVTTIIMDGSTMRMYRNGENVANVELLPDDKIFINMDNWH